MNGGGSARCTSNDEAGVNATSLMPWVSARKLSAAGWPTPATLAPRPCWRVCSPGHPPKLSDAQKRLIPEFLWHGAEAYGFRGQVWTCARIALVIEEEFGVRYHKDHVGRLLRNCNGRRRCRSSGPSSVTRRPSSRWRVEVWPELLRRAKP